MKEQYMKLYHGFMDDAALWRRLWKASGRLEGGAYRRMMSDAFRKAIDCKVSALAIR